MTRFWRDGFWRTSVYGTTHWVEGHWVDRDAWDRSSSGSSRSYYAELLTTARATRSFTSSFVNPNAECSVCGAPVFFYQNEFGSRVFFDELGPPWPKHPCTDNSDARQAPVAASIRTLEPAWRSENEVSAITWWQQNAGQHPLFAFRARYSQTPWSRVRVAKRLKFSNGVLLAVVIEREDVSREAFLRAKRLPRSVGAGTVAFLNGKTLSFFDSASMSVAEAPVERVKSLADTVRLLME